MANAQRTQWPHACVHKKRPYTWQVIRGNFLESSTSPVVLAPSNGTLSTSLLAGKGKKFRGVGFFAQVTSPVPENGPTSPPLSIRRSETPTEPSSPLPSPRISSSSFNELKYVIVVISQSSIISLISKEVVDFLSLPFSPRRETGTERSTVRRLEHAKKES